MERKKTYRLVTLCMLSAMYFVLAHFLAIKIGNLHFTLSSLPTVLAAVLFGPFPAALAAGVGEFLNQLLGYGLTPTTPLWVLPPVVRVLLIGAFVAWAKKTPRRAEERPVALLFVCIGAAIVTTLVNTGMIWLDSVIFDYSTFAYVFGSFFARLFTGVVTAVLVAVLVIPLTEALRRSGAADRWF